MLELSTSGAESRGTMHHKKKITSHHSNRHAPEFSRNIRLEWETVEWALNRNSVLPVLANAKTCEDTQVCPIINAMDFSKEAYQRIRSPVDPPLQCSKHFHSIRFLLRGRPLEPFPILNLSRQERMEAPLCVLLDCGSFMSMERPNTHSKKRCADAQ